MTQREKNLAIAVVTLIVGWGGWLAWGWWSDAYARRTSEHAAAQIAYSEAQLREAEARASLRKLEILRERSLPADPEAAQAAYRDWLVGQLAESGIALESIRPLGTPADKGGAYTALPFDVQASAEPKAITRFLHAFYSTPATHKITQLKLTPSGPAGRLRVDLDVEAIVVRGAGNKLGLPEGPSGRLRLASREAYVNSIAGRSLFEPYQPPPPPAPPRPPKVADKPKPPAPPPFDDSTQAHFTGVVGTGDRLQAWVLVRTKGERLSLAGGDELKVGLLEGRVLQVLPRRLVYEAEGKRYSVSLGDSLREGKPIAADGVL